MKTNNDVELFLKAIPRHIRDQFKSSCARRGFSMAKMLKSFMKLYAQDTQKFPLPEWIDELERAIG